ncbi:hypothetical protein ABMA28_001632 [Loxostege sticticalis]|uniref:Uncharacterized protein n=1 Tax=Loxostege sticticalis TaxID=481309 RepID=A0ABD0T2L7_LOXSC
MFKAVSVCVFLIVAASAHQYEDLENLIEYGESPYGGFVVPYPYQEHKEVVVKPLPLYPDAIVSVVPSPVTEVGYSKLGLVSTVVSFGVGLVKKAVVFVLANAPALIIGTLAAFGVCKCTPICSMLSSVNSLSEVPTELRSFATPERLAKASDFVKKAIRKYRSLQEEEH